MARGITTCQQSYHPLSAHTLFSVRPRDIIPSSQHDDSDLSIFFEGASSELPMPRMSDNQVVA